ncbi:MAG: hypothetical protein D6805_02455 [Planctomycetota bacterium]|nr:MAG: hypothetical protein D6805_02455 [Planctomycetota bacterium]
MDASLSRYGSLKHSPPLRLTADLFGSSLTPLLTKGIARTKTIVSALSRQTTIKRQEIPFPISSTAFSSLTRKTKNSFFYSSLPSASLTRKKTTLANAIGKKRSQLQDYLSLETLYRSLPISFGSSNATNLATSLLLQSARKPFPQPMPSDKAKAKPAILARKFQEDISKIHRQIEEQQSSTATAPKEESQFSEENFLEILPTLSEEAIRLLYQRLKEVAADDAFAMGDW